MFFSPIIWGARHSYLVKDTTIEMLLSDSITPASRDSLSTLSDSISKSGRLSLDSLAVDSIPTDTLKKKKGALDAIVDYTANDSIVLTGSNFGYLYGDADVKYADIELKSENIVMSMDSSIAYATFGVDSIGDRFGYPTLSQGGTDYESETMRYNFKTQKAFITNYRTQQGDGFVNGGKARKNEDNSYYMTGVQYTTCDEHEHPHFYLALTKAKLEPGKRIVTGPAYLVIEDLPLPIAIPFGFFPFTSKYSSGVIMPSYADRMDLGFGLLDGGYYFAINDYIDLALTGDIYTKGSYGIKARSNYKKRYQFSGGFDINYIYTKLSEKGLADYSEAKDFRINWTHTQDPKANTYRTLSASVNYATSSYDHNSVSTQYSNSYSNNTKGSTVTLSQRFPNSPWTLNAGLSIAQRSQDSTVSVTFPNLTINMSRVYPFKRKEAVGSEKWYEKINMTYNGDFRNSITTKDDELLKKNIIKDWDNGMEHTIPISATFSIFNNINVTPSINYKERWYTRKTKESIVDNKPMVTDTINGFSRVYNYSTSISFQTKLYGMYEPLFSKTTRIRHVFTPSVSFSYSPDFSDPKYGYWEKLSYYDSNGQLIEYEYSPYRYQVFSPPSGGKQGSVTFQFDNNIEMKVKSDADSTGFKKISLIDNLGIGFNYNFAADKYKLSDFNTNLRLKLTKSLTFNIAAVWDPYLYEGNERTKVVTKLDKLRMSQGSFPRLKSTGYSIAPSINQDTFKKWFGGGDDSKDKSKSENKNEDGDENEESSESKPRESMFAKKKADGEYDADGYLKTEIKWNLSFSFGMNYSYSDFNYKKNEYNGRWTKYSSINGAIQPTKNWSFSFSTSYDFDAKKFSDLYCTLSRDLHCWSISANFRPIGTYKTYFISLRANSSLLQDLKYEQRGRTTSYDPNWD